MTSCWYIFILVNVNNWIFKLLICMLKNPIIKYKDATEKLKFILKK